MSSGLAVPALTPRARRSPWNRRNPDRRAPRDWPAGPAGASRKAPRFSPHVHPDPIPTEPPGAFPPAHRPAAGGGLRRLLRPHPRGAHGDRGAGDGRIPAGAGALDPGPEAASQARSGPRRGPHAAGDGAPRHGPPPALDGPRPRAEPAWRVLHLRHPAGDPRAPRALHEPALGGRVRRSSSRAGAVPHHRERQPPRAARLEERRGRAADRSSDRGAARRRPARLTSRPFGAACPPRRSSGSRRGSSSSRRSRRARPRSGRRSRGGRCPREPWLPRWRTSSARRASTASPRRRPAASPRGAARSRVTDRKAAATDGEVGRDRRRALGGPHRSSGDGVDGRGGARARMDRPTRRSRGAQAA